MAFYVHTCRNVTTYSCVTKPSPALLVRNFLEGKMLHDGDESLLGEYIVFKLDIEGPSTLGIPGRDSN